MEDKNKKIIIIGAAVIFILVLVFVAGKKDRQPKVNRPAPNVTTNAPASVPSDDQGKILETVEMGNAIGTVKDIEPDSITLVKDDGSNLKLTINGKFNVLTFIDQNGVKSVKQVSLAEVKNGSKVSVQYSQENVVMSMYLIQ